MRVINLPARARSWWQWATCWITVQSAPLPIEWFKELHPASESLFTNAKPGQRFSAVITATTTLGLAKREHGISRPVCRAAQRKPQQKTTGRNNQRGSQTPRDTAHDLSASTGP